MDTTFLIQPRFGGDADRAMGIHRFLVRLSSAWSAAFLWVFIYIFLSFSGTVGQALIQTLLLYALSETTHILLVPFAMRRLRGGMLRGTVYGSLLMCVAFIYTAMLISGFFPNGIAFIGIIFGAYRALYRIPYTVERAAIISARKPSLAGELALALSPFFAGFLLMSIGSDHLLFIAASLAALSLLPLAFVPNVHEKFSWDYRDTFGRLVARENAPLLLMSIWQGILAAFLYLIAPLLLLFLLPSSALGAAYSLILLIILLMRASRRAPVEHTVDGGTYLDEYTALKEMGSSFGRLCVAFASVAVIFLVAF